MTEMPAGLIFQLDAINDVKFRINNSFNKGFEVIITLHKPCINVIIKNYYSTSSLITIINLC